jgi:phosphoglycolate phosphatase-like HAD superfamily hydrolase
MNFGITDFDGVIQNTEPGKAFSYIAAITLLTGNMPRTTIEEVINECAGGQTMDYVNNVWRKFQPYFKEAGTGKFSKDKREKLEKKLFDKKNLSWAKEILQDANLEKNFSANEFFATVLETCEELLGKKMLLEKRKANYDFVYQMSQPIKENISFFREAVNQGIQWGLINQSERDKMQKHFIRDKELGIDVEGLFENRWIFCIGTEGVFSKVEGYEILCDRMNINPRDTLTFEDTALGVASAKKAGLLCVGLGDEELLKNSGADFVLSARYLDSLIPKISEFKKMDAKDFINFLKRH